MIPRVLSRFLPPRCDVGPRLEQLDAAAEDERQRVIAQTNTAHGKPPRIKVEAIKPGDREWWSNIADPSCSPPPEGCGGAGRTSRVVDGQRQWVPCLCIDPERGS